MTASFFLCWSRRQKAPSLAQAAGPRRARSGVYAARRRRAAMLQVKWAHFVQALDADPRERPPMHYVATARMMAEVVGSVLPEDFGDATIKNALLAGLPASGSKPFI